MPPGPKVAAVIEFIEAHLEQDLMVPDLARYADTSVRWLQKAFREEVGVSPAYFLRMVRLRRIREDLLAANPSTGATVQSIARRRGIRHLGRFASFYWQHYHEYPSETLYGR
jgi:transcriptional regulator GlxA family with amidase domain